MFYQKLRLAACLVMLLSLPAGYLVSQLEVDNRQEKLVNQSGATAQIYQRFKQDFGEDEFVIIALSGRDLFSEDALDDMLYLVEELEAIDRVSGVNGIPTLFRDIFGEEDIDALYEEITSTPFYRNLLISEDEKVAGLMVGIEDLESVATRIALVESIEHVVSEAQEIGFRVDVVGQPIFNTAINRASQLEVVRAFPFAGVTALLILLVLLRSIKAALAVLVCGGLTLLYTLASIQLLGWQLNLITTSLPLVLFVLAIANGIHITSRYQRTLLVESDRVQAMRQTLSELVMSCGLSSITTAMGFLSLLVADLNAVFQMGIYMAIGIVYSLLINLSMGAWLLVVLKVKPAEGAGRHLGRNLQQRVAFTMLHPKSIIACFALFASLGVASLFNVKSASDAMQFLPQNSTLIQSYAFVSERLTGLTSLELVVHTPDGWLNPAYWASIEKLSAEIESIEVVKRVHSPLSLLKKMHQWQNGGDVVHYSLPATRAEAEEVLNLLDEGQDQQLSAYVSADGERIRISILAGRSADGAVSELAAEVENLTAQLTAPLRAQTTGISMQMKVLNEGLFTTQLISYGTAFLLIFGVIGLGLRSMHLLLLSILPNLIPMLSIYLLMNWLAIPLNAATFMVASISLGIAVDNTVHFLVRFHKQRRQGELPLAAAKSTILQVGPSITITTLTACIGFYALVSSAFPPISQLGLLSGSAILAALISNLLLLPAIIAVSPGEKKSWAS